MTGEPKRTLIEDAYHLLKTGPRPSAQVAEHVLRLRGHAEAQEAAVRALLGPDARFLVDELGQWMLTPGAETPGERLDRLEYAVVDVETTGGRYDRGHRITEVAAVEVREGGIHEVWHTVVNPGRWISGFVEGLTGITQQSVAGAPFFEEIAESLLGRLQGRVFVGHNVRFDWGFVTAELASALGDVPDVPRLCTIRLARHLVPQLRRRSLDGLADHFGIPIFDRHRAHGDALATARVLIRLLDRAGQLGIQDLNSLQRYLRRPRQARGATGESGRREELP